MPEASRLTYSTESAAKKMGIHKRVMLRLAAKIGKTVHQRTFNVFTETDIQRMKEAHAEVTPRRKGTAFHRN